LGGNDIQGWHINGELAETENCGLAPGIFSLTYSGDQYCFTQEILQINDADSISITATAPLSCGGSPVALNLSVSGINGNYEIILNDNSNPSMLLPGSYQGEINTASGCTGFFSVEVEEVPQVFFEINSDTLCSETTAMLQYEISGGTPGYVTDWQGVNPMFAPAGEYFAVVRDQNNCLDTAHYRIHPFVSIEASNAIDSICPGSATASHLLVGGGYEPIIAEWNNADPDSLTSGEYEVTLTDAAGCSFSINYVVNQYPLMLLNILVTYPIDSIPGIVELSVEGGSPPYSYTWNSNAGESNQTWYDSVNYVIEITDSAGCVLADSIQLTPLMTEDIHSTLSLPYPNPTTNDCYIELTEMTQLRLYNAEGQMIFRNDQCIGRETICTDQLAEGVYLLLVGNRNGKSIHRIVKAK
jgi:hypothetical protein